MQKNQLTTTELKVVKLVCQDKENKAIADVIGVSLRQLEKYKTRIYTKTNTHSNLGLFKWAVKNNVVKFKGN